MKKKVTKKFKSGGNPEKNKFFSYNYSYQYSLPRSIWLITTYLANTAFYFHKNFLIMLHCEAAIAQSVQRLATGSTVRGSNPCEDEIFRIHKHRPWVPPSLLYIGYRVFPGGKAAGPWRLPPNTIYCRG